MKSLQCILFGFTMLFVAACTKDRPDNMKCYIQGQVMVRDLNTPATFPAGEAPTVQLFELEYQYGGDIFSPVQVTERLIASVKVDQFSWYHFHEWLNRGNEYQLKVVNYDTNVFAGVVTKEAAYVTSQEINIPLIPVSWIKPRFLNATNLPGDTFTYVGGIGGMQFPSPFAGKVDTLMPWIYKTWGGSDLGHLKHYVYGIIRREGVTRDTMIYYYAPPADTSVVTIQW